MELNVACLRDILLVVAAKPFGHYINSRNLKLDGKYSKEVISETIQALYESNLIKVENEYLLNGDVDYSIGELTPSGCDLLTSLKDETVFHHINKTLYDHHSPITVRTLQRLTLKYDKRLH
ncbi:hypothetical protein JCM15457_248 [Liquorilactobacillus sucicola DSM 21376 = JCM 15457]|uniref:Uncharacterized protein n=1 Tax=Liquorilactobacillus sucicola DSM 21376 = JCM 15457 TaxID=1423806 RepID=A0A023CV13_9LACO|nr:DUF2513 domain-containing protein [Liquorilactobacillus sucicola]KRN05319.1 hypothetical protein FD15_GL001870 [Liquorilactobacillus sucicola DSM 21376 = JCM 15457]GAJ25385.1 hypothetical protein JCM15457_248 [Liquorilactobacillus sucicola DSM 21376 = JCM 15457]